MANDGGDFARSMGIATSGLRAQAGRMRVISENIANADSTAQNAGGDPYRRKGPTFSARFDRTRGPEGGAPRDPDRRKVPTFSAMADRTLDAKVVALGRVMPDPSGFRVKHAPGNPAAD